MSHALSAEGLRDLAREFRLPMTIYTTNDSLEPAQAIDPRIICIPVEDEEAGFSGADEAAMGEGA